MHVTLVDIRVKPEHVPEFVAATRGDHEGSVREPGNVRFDVLQDPADPAHFLLYEMYASAEAAALHRETPHYLKWRDTVAGWMASPRQGIRWNLLYPQG